MMHNDNYYEDCRWTMTEYGLIKERVSGYGWFDVCTYLSFDSDDQRGWSLLQLLFNEEVTWPA